MQLEYLMTYHADLKTPQAIGKTQFGTRAIYDVTGGTFEGPKLKGKILPSGGDWILLDDNGVGRLDVRATFETDDGALIYVQYFGIVVMHPDAAAAGETQFGDTYFMTQPRFETGDDRYRWLNNIVVVGEGRTLPNAVEYKLYQLTN
ncbi:MAG: DUF3237 domain-containing protein [Gammaproteobacteria bacterium]|nr:DUF3237 domain-containing protein [Gammaproteobacteria bacterium]